MRLKDDTGVVISTRPSRTEDNEGKEYNATLTRAPTENVVMALTFN